MKHYISEEEKKRQIEKMWEDYENANKANFNNQNNDFKNFNEEFFDDEEELSTEEPVRYEKLSEGKNFRQKFKKKGGHNSSKKSNHDFE